MKFLFELSYELSYPSLIGIIKAKVYFCKHKSWQKTSTIHLLLLVYLKSTVHLYSSRMEVWAALLIRMIFHDSKHSEKDRITVQQNLDKEYTIKERVWFYLSTVGPCFAVLSWEYPCGYLAFHGLLLPFLHILHSYI